MRCSFISLCDEKRHTSMRFHFMNGGNDRVTDIIAKIKTKDALNDFCAPNAFSRCILCKCINEDSVQPLI